MSRDAATEAVQAVLQGITAALGQGEEVRLNGFGVFSVADTVGEFQGASLRYGNGGC